MIQLYDLKKNEGYTLVETVVAMTLFVSVLLPLLGSIGSLMTDNKPMITSQALAALETEMAKTLANRDWSESDRTIKNGFKITRTVEIQEKLVFVTIAVMKPNSKTPLIISATRVVLNGTLK